jgi:UPF0755 protein
MTIRGGNGPRDDREPARGRPPMARPLSDAPAPDRRSEVPTRPAGASRRAGTVSAYEVAHRRSGGGLGGFVRFGLFLGVAAAVVLVLLGTVLRPIARSLVVGAADANPGALSIPFVADFVREDLGEDLTAPASDDATEVEFTIASGETASGIADRLTADGLLRDPRAFLLVAIEKDLAGALDAGTFLVRRNLTPEQLVATLLEAKDPSIVAQLRTGLRLEQITAYLQARPPEIATLQMDAADFLELVRNPPASLLADYPWLDLPEGATLEGYLAAGSYRILPDATAEELVRKMLDRFAAEGGPERVRAAKEAGRPFSEVLALASLVERETPLDAERALVAGVYQNRLDEGMLLQADPTVIWGVDLLSLADLPLERWPEFSFWNVPGEPLASIDFPKRIAGYQTYQLPGLIPGPIATPTMASIDAALAPDTAKGYRYFVAIPGGGGEHDFSKTYEQHLQKLRKYGYIE